MNIQFDDKFSFGTLMNMLTIVGCTLAFLFRKYFSSEEDSRRLDSHQELLAEQTKICSQIVITQNTQQAIMDRMEKRFDRIEDALRDAGRSTDRQR